MPEVALLPLQEPEAVQVVALVELQVIVAALPLVRLVGLVEIVTVGTGGGGLELVAMLTAVDRTLSLAGLALS